MRNVFVSKSFSKRKSSLPILIKTLNHWKKHLKYTAHFSANRVRSPAWTVPSGFLCKLGWYIRCQRTMGFEFLFPSSSFSSCQDVHDHFSSPLAGAFSNLFYILLLTCGAFENQRMCGGLWLRESRAVFLLPKQRRGWCLRSPLWLHFGPWRILKESQMLTQGGWHWVKETGFTDERENAWSVLLSLVTVF